MGKFDLNDPADFARATNSFGASILQTFTGRGNSAWNIDEGAYESGTNLVEVVKFHIFSENASYQAALSQVSDSGGRRKAKFLFPYIDGQLTEDMGRMPETFSLDIVLHGNHYYNAFVSLMRLLNQPVPGTLVHPVRGRIRCAMESYDILHQDSQRKAVAIKLTMTEHSIDALALTERVDTSVASKLSDLVNAFKKIEDAINAVQGATFLVTSVINQITQNLEAYQTSFSTISGNMNATFNGSGNIPALLPVQSGGLQDGSGNIITNATTIAASPNDPLAGIVATFLDPNLQTAIAVEQIERDIIASRAQVEASIEELMASGNGVGALEFFDNIIDLRETANSMQAAFEAGKQSSQLKIIKYVTPRDMSVREVAFDNGLTPDDGIEIALLNTEMESLNFIPKGTMLRIAVT